MLITKDVNGKNGAVDAGECIPMKTSCLVHSKAHQRWFISTNLVLW